MLDSLPEGFQDLQRFVGKWSLPKESERQRARLSSTMPEIGDFYDAVLPRMDPIITYLNRFPLDKMPPDAERLLNLAMSFMEAAVCVELFADPDMPWAIEAERMKIDEQWKRC